MSVATPKRVLIADDDERLLRIMRLFLESQGYAVETAANGEEAVAAALRETPALVILDDMMPGIDGPTACRTLRHAPATSRVPILVYSTTADTHALAAGADELVAKPFNLPFLARSVHDHIDRAWGEGTAERIRRPLQEQVAPFPAGGKPAHDGTEEPGDEQLGGASRLAG